MPKTALFITVQNKMVIHSCLQGTSFMSGKVFIHKIISVNLFTQLLECSNGCNCVIKNTFKA